MCHVAKAIPYFLVIYPNCHIVEVNSNGLSGGLIAMWNPHFTKFHAYGFFIGILLSRKIKSVSKSFYLINLYATCCNRPDFWNYINSYGILNIHNLLIMVDFNATLSSIEHWDSHNRSDSMDDRLFHIFVDHHLIDICPLPQTPTWTNHRIGDAFISKILDRALVNECVLKILGNLKLSIITSSLSDHHDICLKW